MVALPNPSSQPKTYRWRPGAARQVGRCPPKSAHFLPQNRLFWPKTAPKPSHNGQTKANASHIHVRPHCPVNKSPFLPPSSTICPRNSPKMAQTGLNVRCLCQTTPKPRTARILGYVAQNQILRAPIPPATPHFLWFPSLKIAQRDPYTLVPVVTSCSWRAAQPAHSWGQRWVHRGPPGEKNDFFQSCS